MPSAPRRRPKRLDQAAGTGTPRLRPTCGTGRPQSAGRSTLAARGDQSRRRDIALSTSRGTIRELPPARSSTRGRRLPRVPQHYRPRLPDLLPVSGSQLGARQRHCGCHRVRVDGARGEQMARELLSYKDSRVQAPQRIRMVTGLGAVLWKWLARHERCVAGPLGVEGFDVITTVPSTGGRSSGPPAAPGRSGCRLRREREARRPARAPATRARPT